jgi:hypothetical protein
MMLRRFLSPLRRADWKGLGARAGALVSMRTPAGRRALFAAAFVFVVLLVHREVYSLVVRNREFRVPSVRVAVAPSWVDSRGAEVVRVDTEGSTLFDPDLVDRVGRAFEACPWVRRVAAVERAFPNALRVRLEYRRPHVAVRRPNGFVLVDSEGVRLPGVYADPPPCDRPMRVAGVSASPPVPGRAWDDPAVRTGLAMADYVERTPLLRELGIREVDVSNLGGRVDPRRSEVALVTANGCALLWGRTPWAGRFGDIAEDEKLENLQGVLAAYPSLNGVRSVKVYFRGSRPIDLVEGITKRPR